MDSDKIFLEDPTCNAFDARVLDITPTGLVLERTAFYANSGGQPGDTGTINGLAVLDTVKDKEQPGRILHLMAPDDLARFTVGQTIEGALDWARRYNHMRMHTALHLVCALVPGYATGNQIRADSARIDFDIDRADLDQHALTSRLNELIAADSPISTGWIDDAELDRNPSLVRTLSVQPPRGNGRIRIVTIGPEGAPVDRQPCGGTHVASTGLVGPIAIIKIENKGKMNKRLNLAFVEQAA